MSAIFQDKKDFEIGNTRVGGINSETAAPKPFHT